VLAVAIVALVTALGGAAWATTKDHARSAGRAVPLAPPAVVVRKGPDVNVPDTGPIVRDAAAGCNRGIFGEKATGGGIQVSQPTGATAAGVFGTFTLISRPDVESGTPTGWFVRARNTSGSAGSASTLNAYAICAS
jgi:hypothetical protein